MERDENWGLKGDGYNRLFKFQAPEASAVTALETSFRRYKRVFRYKTVRLG